MTFKRTWRWLASAAAVGALGLVGALGFALWPAPPGDLSCRHVALIDQATGAPVRGVEDIALDPLAPRLILSAYDRRTDDMGGVYAVEIGALLAPDTMRLAAARMSGPLQPHGFGLGTVQNGNVSFVVVERARTKGGAGVQAYRLSRDGLVASAPPHDDTVFCNANDVALDSSGQVFVTTDRGACGAPGRLVEDFLALPRGRVFALGDGAPLVLAEKIAFANGVAADADHLYVAATRAGAVLVYPRSPADARLGPPRSLAVAGAPDNLAIGDDGALYIAAHRSLLRYALFRAGLRGDAASNILRYDPGAGDAARPVLIGQASRRGAVAGTTVALSVRGALVLGAAYDAGISVCAEPGGHAL